MLIANLLRLNWHIPIIPRRWLRFLYRSEILESHDDIYLPFETDFFGLRYPGDINNVIDFHCFFYGAFEKGHLFFWSNIAEGLFNNKGVYVDIGANVGHHSIFMSKKSSVVHAFEPYKPVHDKIIEKINLNRLTNIIVHNVGIGNKNEMLPFFEPVGTNLGIGTFVGKQQEFDKKNELQLPVVSGDEYFDNNVSDEINMIKIDVEGFEKNVIRGLRKTMERCRPVIVFELGLGLDCSFSSNSEIIDIFPDNYMFFTFDIWDKSGNKDKGKDSLFRKKGLYKLTSFEFDSLREQADVVAFPCEQIARFAKAFPGKLCQ